LPRFSRGLNAILLGEAEASALGVAVERIKRSAVLWVACAVGAVVSCCGMIGFIGLVVPHLVRMILGADHRLVLPASAIFGSALLLLSDLLARTIYPPVEIPIGVV